VAGSIAAFLTLYGYTGAALVAGRLPTAHRPVMVGSKTFTEQYILSEILARTIETRTDHSARAVQSLGSTVLFDALDADEIDVYVDYSGTIWATIMERSQLPEDRSRVLTEVERYLANEHGVVLIGSLGFENTYALAMRGEQARSLGVATISDLVPHAPTLEIGGDYEFFARPEWAALVSAYGLRFRARRSMDSSLMYQAARTEEVDAISAFSTDGRIAAFDLRVLIDDRGVIPPYDAVVLASARMARDAPEVVAALRRLQGTIDASDMRRMNMLVDREGRAPAAVAAAFVDGLDTDRAASPGPAASAPAEER
jgi:osmoprotectant transport system permease protein